jgi:hypothetical protein
VGGLQFRWTLESCSYRAEALHRSEDSRRIQVDHLKDGSSLVVVDAADCEAVVTLGSLAEYCDAKNIGNFRLLPQEN